MFKRLIHVEEEYLEERFGEAYRAYRARVHEVIPIPKAVGVINAAILRDIVLMTPDRRAKPRPTEERASLRETIYRSRRRPVRRS